MRIDFEITYRGETVNLDETASQMVVSFTIYDGNFPNGGSITQVQSDWNQTNNTQVDFIKNKPTIPSTAGLATETFVTDITDNKADLENGVIPASQLPSYVDDVLAYANLASFPVTGESAKVYIANDTNKTYRWTGSTYANLDEGVVLGETSSTAYRGDRGKEAYDLKHSHTNKSILDLIEDAFTTALKTAYDTAVINATNAMSWITTNGTNILNHLSNTLNPHSVTALQVGAYTTTEVNNLLATKQNSLIVASNFTNGTPLTGTAVETTLYTLEVNGGILGVGIDPKFFALCTKTGTATYPTLRIKVNSSNTLVGATTLATLVPSSGVVVWLPMERRTIHIDSASSTIYPTASSNAHTDMAGTSSAFASANINHTVKQYYFLTAQLASGVTADLLLPHYFYISI